MLFFSVFFLFFSSGIIIFIQTPCLIKKKKVAEEVNLSFAIMVIGRPITTFSKNN